MSATVADLRRWLDTLPDGLVVELRAGGETLPIRGFVTDDEVHQPSHYGDVRTVTVTRAVISANYYG
jgi:hypothetical protein